MVATEVSDNQTQSPYDDSRDLVHRLDDHITLAAILRLGRCIQLRARRSTVLGSLAGTFGRFTFLPYR